MAKQANEKLLAEKHLRDLLVLQDNMKIVIDERVEQDGHGNYQINVGYLRVSTDRQAEQGYGLDIQEADILKYAQANQLPNLVLYIDDGYTGTKLDRPALQAIVRLIDNYNLRKSRVRVSAFIVARIDRLSRSLLGTLQFIQDYIVCAKDSHNSQVNRNPEDISFISVTEKACRVEQDNPQGKFLLMLFATLAEFDRDQIVQKMRRGKEVRVRSGKWPGGGNPPLGYIYNAKTGMLEIDEPNAEIVREMFRLYLEEKWTPQRIADMYGAKSDRSITQRLRNKTYAGYLLFRGKEYPDHHPAIISLELWLEVQAELERRSAHRTATEHLLSGLVVCGDCGSKMHYQKWGKQGSRLVCYASQVSSRKRFHHEKSCGNKLFRAKDVEDAVLRELFQLSYLGDESRVKQIKMRDPVEVLQRQLDAAKRKLSRLYDFDDGAEDEVLREKIFQARKEVRRLEEATRKERENNEQANQIRKATELLRTLKSTWPRMSELERQSVCRSLIDRVVVFQDGTVDVHLKLESYLEEDK